MPWFGKGLRGPLHDAIVSQAVSSETRGRAFGFHRAMDTVGAVAGPLLGVALLCWAQHLPWDDAADPFRLVLWLSIIPGVLAVLAFLFLVHDPEHSPNPALRFVGALRELPARFKNRRLLAQPADPGGVAVAGVVDGRGAGGPGRGPVPFSSDKNPVAVATVATAATTRPCSARSPRGSRVTLAVTPASPAGCPRPSPKMFGSMNEPL